MPDTSQVFQGTDHGWSDPPLWEPGSVTVGVARAGRPDMLVSVTIGKEAVTLNKVAADTLLASLRNLTGPPGILHGRVLIVDQARTDRGLAVGAGPGDFTADGKPWVRIRIVDPATMNSRALASVDVTFETAERLIDHLDAISLVRRLPRPNPPSREGIALA